MIVHSYYYGPTENGGLDLNTTRGLSQVVNEDVIRELYSMDGHQKKTVRFSKLYQTLHGPVIGITRIEPAQAHDKRTTIINKTWFIKLEDVVKDLTRVLDYHFTVKDVKPIELIIDSITPVPGFDTEE